VVLPVPGWPSIRKREPLVKPPDRTSSSPGIPEAAWDGVLNLPPLFFLAPTELGRQSGHLNHHLKKKKAVLFDGVLRSQEQLLLLLHVSHASHAASGRHGGSLRLWLLRHHGLGGISAVRTTLAGSITPWLKLTTLPPQIAGIRNDIPFGLNSKKEMRATQCTNDNMITLRAIKTNVAFGGT
jgi:hypothetical protein